MTPERYQRIGQLFDAALELALEQRTAYLEQACGVDAPLRADVEKLLANSVESGEFLSRPAMDVAAELLYQAEFQSSGSEIFEPGWRFKLNLTSPARNTYGWFGRRNLCPSWKRSGDSSIP
jgi:hypothetical protein